GHEAEEQQHGGQGHPPPAPASALVHGPPPVHPLREGVCSEVPRTCRPCCPTKRPALWLGALPRLTQPWHPRITPLQRCHGRVARAPPARGRPLCYRPALRTADTAAAPRDGPPRCAHSGAGSRLRRGPAPIN